MSKYHILDRTLGVLWLVLFSSYGIYMLWQICHVFAISQKTYEDSQWAQGMSVSILLCLLCIVGALASIFFLCGASWARKTVGLVAVIFVLLDIANWSLEFWAVAQGVFALVSACWLLFPRRVVAS